ncbi:hypothetical protein FB45DRAFT_997746, partial [Roridomyces roridus]
MERFKFDITKILSLLPQLCISPCIDFPEFTSTIQSFTVVVNTCIFHLDAVWEDLDKVLKAATWPSTSPSPSHTDRHVYEDIFSTRPKCRSTPMEALAAFSCQGHWLLSRDQYRVGLEPQAAVELWIQHLHHKTELICQGTFNIEDLLQKSKTAHRQVIGLSLSKSGNKKLGRLWIRLTESLAHSETHDTAALDQTPAAASSGAIPDTETWRQDIGKKVKQTWQGLHQITRIIAPFVPEPFNTPFEIFNTISDVAVEYMENKEAVEDALVKLSAQLVEVEGVLLDSEKYNIDITTSSKELADLVIKQAVEMRNIQSKATAKKIFEQHEITGKISQCIDILKQGTDNYHRRMSLAIARDVKKNVDFALASMLPSFAARALFDADTGAATSPRRACTPGTRKELLEKLENWALDKSPNTSPIFWLSGMAGTGKSTVAYTICKLLQGHKQFGA